MIGLRETAPAFLLLGFLATQLQAGPTESEPIPPDSLGGYLESLSRWDERSFSKWSLDVDATPDSILDSLITYYEITGEAPRAVVEPERHWDFSPRLAGFRYSRVEGLNLIPGASLRFPTRRKIELLGEIGYGTASEEVTWEAGMEARLTNRFRSPRVSVSYGRDVDGYGAGGVFGNSLTALLLGEDYRDYYRREGWIFKVRLRPNNGVIRFSYRIEDQDSIATATQFALFDHPRPFRVNPAIDPGEVRRFGLRAEWRRLFGIDLMIAGDGVVAGGGLGGDFEYQSVRLETKVGGTWWRGDLVTLRLAGGVIGGKEVPYQALHHLGGFAALRGYGINEIGARRFVHAALDYEIGTDLLRSIPLLRRLRIQFMPFFDGAAIFETQKRGEESVELSEPTYKFATGLGLQKNFLGIPGGGGQVRVEIARRLDRGDDTMTYRARISVEN